MNLVNCTGRKRVASRKFIKMKVFTSDVSQSGRAVSRVDTPKGGGPWAENLSRIKPPVKEARICKYVSQCGLRRYCVNHSSPLSLSYTQLSPFWIKECIFLYINKGVYIFINVIVPLFWILKNILRHYLFGDKIIQNCASKISQEVLLNNYPQKS